MEPEFTLPQEENDFYVTKNVQASFEKHGYILVRGMLKPEEVSKLKDYAESDSEIAKYAYAVDDGKGGKSRLCIWNHPGEDISGAIIRSQKIAGTAQALLGGDEVYHYSTKLMMKEPRTGGSFVWHQDYGYFYQNGCIFPEMAAIFMPIDRSVKANGCLQVLKGSHRLGRINHILSGEQAGVEPDYLDAALSRFPLQYIEMEPGDALFFHCNLLHSSSKNESDMRRWVMITTMNKRINSPIRPCPFPSYTPLNIIPNSKILASEHSSGNVSFDKGFLKDSKQDNSASSIENRSKENNGY